MNMHTAANRISTGRLVTIALLAALTLIGSTVLKIQTPTFGYIHLGDGFVLLSGFLLGPTAGGLAAGIGSALSDLLGGYPLWVLPTFLIKFLMAVASSLLYRALTGAAERLSARRASSPELPASRQKMSRHSAKLAFPALIPSGIAGETVMVCGYFVFNIFMVCLNTGSFDRIGLTAAFGTAVAGLPFNLVQGAAGILLSLLLCPVFAGIRRKLPQAG